MTYEELIYLRESALKLAIQDEGEPERVVARAKVYEAFILGTGPEQVGGTQDTSNEPTPGPQAVSLGVPE